MTKYFFLINVMQCNALHLDKDKEKDKERDKEREKNKKNYDNERKGKIKEVSYDFFREFILTMGLIFWLSILFFPVYIYRKIRRYKHGKR
ncbi:MAG: hypothetical protein B5M53_09330 [Candidatus Cloacimonas sp. 4484_209]|nr:MAG: hypothetical protein B5M53_09330 [Candidatus Cloacimonas sp. 4484_209]